MHGCIHTQSEAGRKESLHSGRIRTIPPQTELLFPSWLAWNEAVVMLIYIVIFLEIIKE